MSSSVAYWNLELTCDCPSCWQCVDLLDDPDFWDGRKLEPCETMTMASTEVDVKCPECGHRFMVDLAF